MVWMLLVGTGALAVVTALLAASVWRLRARLRSLELRAGSPSGDVGRSPGHAPADHLVALDEPPVRPEFLITRVGEAPAPAPGQSEPAPRVDATLFTDQLVKETAVHAVALAHGVRRALSPESRNRIGFHMRQEVRRARKQRRTEMRLAHREWTARQRAAVVDERAGRGSAA